MRVLLILFAATAAWAQVSDFDKPIFKTDSLDPKECRAVELLEAVCPGKVIPGENVRCSDWCPTGRVTSVLRGHFSTPSGDDALLDAETCASHAESFGGSFLLTRKAGRWELVRYAPGIRTAACHKIASRAGSDLPVCDLTDNHQGNFERIISSVDFTKPGEVQPDILFVTTDSRAGCGLGSPGRTVQRASIDRVDFSPGGMAIHARFGKLPLTRTQAADCNIPPIATKNYTLQFDFNGSSYHLSPRSRAAGRIFE